MRCESRSVARRKIQPMFNVRANNENCTYTHAAVRRWCTHRTHTQHSASVKTLNSYSVYRLYSVIHIRWHRADERERRMNKMLLLISRTLVALLGIFPHFHRSAILSFPLCVYVLSALLYMCKMYTHALSS